MGQQPVQLSFVEMTFREKDLVDIQAAMFQRAVAAKEKGDAFRARGAEAIAAIYDSAADRSLEICVAIRRALYGSPP